MPILSAMWFAAIVAQGSARRKPHPGIHCETAATAAGDRIGSENALAARHQRAVGVDPLRREAVGLECREDL
ncbi:MAG: hypothetical protein ACK4YX_10600, partial [Rhabdaerophilum calidifontis]